MARTSATRSAPRRRIAIHYSLTDGAEKHRLRCRHRQLPALRIPRAIVRFGRQITDTALLTVQLIPSNLVYKKSSVEKLSQTALYDRMPWNPTPFIAIADALALLLQPQAEVVLHDLAEDRILHIAGNFSKRRAGDPSLSDVDELVPFPTGVIGPYAKSNVDGRALKSISVVIRDEAEAPVGLLCVNLDISAIAAARAVLDGLMLTATPTQPQAADLFATDWRERVNAEIAAYLTQRKASLAGLTAEDLTGLVAALDRAGLFAIRKAADHIAAALGVSRATLYKRLAEARRTIRSPAT
jgi:D-arginine utilization repressor